MVRTRSLGIFALGTVLVGMLATGVALGQHDHGGHGGHGAAQKAPAAPAAEEAAAADEIRVEIEGGYQVGPGQLMAGQPGRLRFVRHDSSECSSEVVFPSLGLRKALAQGETVVEVTPERPGVLKFTCGMKMMTGEVPVGD